MCLLVSGIQASCAIVQHPLQFKGEFTVGYNNQSEFQGSFLYLVKCSLVCLHLHQTEQVLPSPRPVESVCSLPNS